MTNNEFCIWVYENIRPFLKENGIRLISESVCENKKYYCSARVMCTYRNYKVFRNNDGIVEKIEFLPKIPSNFFMNAIYGSQLDMDNVYLTCKNRNIEYSLEFIYGNIYGKENLSSRVIIERTNNIEKLNDINYESLKPNNVNCILINIYKGGNLNDKNSSEE